MFSIVFHSNLLLGLAKLAKLAKARMLLHCGHDLAGDHVDLAGPSPSGDFMQNLEAAHIVPSIMITSYHDYHVISPSYSSS